MWFEDEASKKKDIELVFIQDNELAFVKDEDRPKGSFYVFPMRTNTDKMFYGTGIAYMAGLGYGGVYGTLRGIQKAPVMKSKVVWSSILNQTTRYGPWAANSLGVISTLVINVAFTWAVIDSLYSSIREKDDYVNHVGAAFTSGLLFKSTAGLRPALLTGSILSAVVLGYGALTGALTPKKPVFSQQVNAMQA